MRQPYKIAQRVDFDGVVHSKAGLDSDGREIADPTPIAPPIGYNRQPSMMENMRNMVRSEMLRREVEAAGHETFEEADDFDVGEDYDPSSPYEEVFDPPLPPHPSPTDVPPPAPQAAPAPPSDGPATPAPPTAAPSPAPAPAPAKA